MPRAIAYLRVSTDEQAASGAGLDAQLDACRRWADREGCELVGPYRDEGVSGATPLDERPGLADAVAELVAGDVLLVAKRDRLGRDPLVVAYVEMKAGTRGARVVSAAGEGTDDDTPTSILMRRIVDAFAEYERRLIKARTASALAAKRQRGEVTGHPRYGVQVVDDGRRSKKGGNPIAEAPCPEELDTLGLIRRMRSEGASLAQICAALQAREIPTKRGGPTWARSTVAKLLTINPNPTEAA